MATEKQTSIKQPLARSEQVIIQQVDAETVVYDERTKTAHALRPLAAAVFTYADGKNSIKEIAELASYRLAETVSEADVNDAVAQLEASDLLEVPVGLLSQGISRRTALKTFAVASAGTMLVSSVAATFASATTLSNYGNPYSCAYVGSDGAYIMDSGSDAGEFGDPTVSGSQAPKGWPQPYVQSGSEYKMATGTTAGAPAVTGTPTAADYDLGASCYAVGGTIPVYGTYQVVPCDGAISYSCSDVVCVPTSNGKKVGSGGTASVIAGAIISGATYYGGTGSFNAPSGTGISDYGGIYNDYAYATSYPFKICCTTGTEGTCTHNNS